MTPAQLKFTRFKSGPINRTIDTVLGIALIWWGSDFSSIAKDIGFVIGIFALLAGVLNVCWAAPIIGIPFRGKELTGGLDWWKRYGHKTNDGMENTSSAACVCD